MGARVGARLVLEDRPAHRHRRPRHRRHHRRLHPSRNERAPTGARPIRRLPRPLPRERLALRRDRRPRPRRRAPQLRAQPRVQGRRPRPRVHAPAVQVFRHNPAPLPNVQRKRGSNTVHTAGRLPLLRRRSIDERSRRTTPATRYTRLATAAAKVSTNWYANDARAVVRNDEMECSGPALRDARRTIAAHDERGDGRTGGYRRDQHDRREPVRPGLTQHRVRMSTRTRCCFATRRRPTRLTGTPTPSPRLSSSFD